VAERPQSKAKGPVRDVRAREERRRLSREHLHRLAAYLYRVFFATLVDEALIGEDEVWRQLRDAFLVLLYLLTGVRRFEGAGLTHGDVDLLGGKLWVIGKGGIRDFVPLAAPAVRVLERWAELKKMRGEPTDQAAPLFASTGIAGGFLSVAALRLRWKRVLRDAGLPTFYGVHALRHTAGMLVFASTASLEKTARFLRHRNTKITAEYYLHLDPDELRNDLAAIELWRPA
jgi:integrase